jgi:hypothetical protein
MRKANPHADWKPIMDAAFQGHLARLEQLLDAGADPNIVSRTVHRYRPLHRAIEPKKTTPRSERHEEVVRLLLSRGADPKLRGTMEMLTVLQLAAVGDPRFVPIVREYFGLLDIFHAAALGDLVRVHVLLKKDSALATANDGHGWTPLHYCAASRVHRDGPKPSANLVKIAQNLIAAGADPMAPFMFEGNWPLRPLYYAAARANHPAMVEVLLKAGADPCDGESIYHAADEGHEECLALLAANVDRTALADECSMCLCNQMHWGRVRGMEWLLAHGADPLWVHPERQRNAIQEAQKLNKPQRVIDRLKCFTKPRKKSKPTYPN